MNTPYVSVINGYAKTHHNIVQAVQHALNALVPTPAIDTWLPMPSDDLRLRSQTRDRLRRNIEGGDPVSHNGVTAQIFPVDVQDHWSGEGRTDYRGGWDEGGGGILIAGLALNDAEDGHEWTAKLAALGYELEVTVEDEPEAFCMDYADISAWKPLPPEGDGWVLAAGLQSEDHGALVAHWIRPKWRRDVAQENQVQ